MTLQRYLATIFLLFLFLLQINSAWAQKVVRVAGYTFPPFVNQNGAEGLTLDLLAFLNKQQSEFVFKFSNIPPKRRYWALDSATADMILFEMPEWGWKDYSGLIEESRVLFKGGEVYITHAVPGRDQNFFKDIESKSLAGVSGYHYGFAGFAEDRKWLEEHFSILLVENPQHVITLVLKDRAEVGVVTESFLSLFKNWNPEDYKQLLVSEKKDQEYRLKAFVRKEAPISVPEFEALWNDMIQSDDVKRYLRKKGVYRHLME